MDLRVPSPTAGLTSALRVGTGAGLRAPAGLGGGVESAGFSGALKSALRSVSAAQNHSDALQKEVTMDNPKVSLEETMVAIQKAQIGFQATVHVRNRMVQAYSDIMNMQV